VVKPLWTSGMNSLFRMCGLAVIALTGASGCGLSEYQSRMDEQRTRLQNFDDNNRLLDDPIDMPRLKLKDKDGNPGEKLAWPDVFLRLPKGYATTPKDKDPYGYVFLEKQNLFPCYRYAGGS